MARPGLSNHRKFKRLAQRLGSEAVARGHLEFLWEVAYDAVDDYIGDSTDVETAARWHGAPGILTSALAECGGRDIKGFIEAIEDSPTHFRIHDLWDHAPEYVKKRRERELKRRQAAHHLNDDGRRTADSGVRAADNGGRTASFRAVQGSSESEVLSGSEENLKSEVDPPLLTAPTPRGEPVRGDLEPGAPERRKAALREWVELFDLFWPHYPRKIAKRDALKAWREIAPHEPAEVDRKARGVGIVLSERKRRDWRDRPKDRIPYPASFLRAEEFPLLESEGDSHVHP